MLHVTPELVAHAGVNEYPFLVRVIHLVLGVRAFGVFPPRLVGLEITVVLGLPYELVSSGILPGNVLVAIA